jgi:transposase
MATSPTAVPQGKNTTGTGDLYVSFELADESWKLTISDGRRGPSRYSIDAGDVVAVLDCFNKARARCGLAGGCKVHSCYEAGRDGWWLHRWLHEQGVDNIAVDAASIEINRRARRAKTDRLDGDKLLAMLLRHLSGERVWSVLREPSREAEDERRTHRELGRLTHERVAHATRIQGNSPTSTRRFGYSVEVSRSLTSATLKAVGSNEPPIHSFRSRCSGWLGSANAARNSS